MRFWPRKKKPTWNLTPIALNHDTALSVFESMRSMKARPNREHAADGVPRDVRREWYDAHRLSRDVSDPPAVESPTFFLRGEAGPELIRPLGPMSSDDEEE